MQTNELVLQNSKMYTTNSANKKMRFSGVELLRIIAIFLICLCHAIQTSMNFVDYSPSLNFTKMLLQILFVSGQIGNVLFIICSAYFLVDSKKTKAEKAINLLFDSTLISIIIFTGFLIGGYSFSFEDSMRQFLPDLFEHNWFIPVYVLMYLVHPLLNIVINKMGKKVHFTFCFVVIVFYGLVGLILGDEMGVDKLTKFFMIYFIVAYMKLYCGDFANDRKKNVKWFLITFFLFWVLAFIDKLLPVWNSHLDRFISIDYWFSPFLLPMLLFLFNIFKSFQFKNKFINYLASCSLFVYVIHENILLRSYIRPQYYEYVLGLNPDMYFWWIMLCAVGMFIGGMILSIIYKETFHRLTVFLSKKTAQGFYKLRDFAYKKINKEEVLIQSAPATIQETPTHLENTQEKIGDIESSVDLENFEKQDTALPKNSPQDKKDETG